eukprot:scaffold2961_cov118-Isochrysis_galbana.AAC.2
MRNADNIQGVGCGGGRSPAQGGLNKERDGDKGEGVWGSGRDSRRAFGTLFGRKLDLRGPVS